MTTFIDLPDIIEFSGLSAVGKTTTLHGLKNELTKNGLKCAVVSEAAQAAPVSVSKFKEQWLFNVWTLTKTLNQVIEISNKEYDVILIERGFFDTICWFNWFESKGSLDPHIYNSFYKILTEPIWAEKTIKVIYLTVDWKKAFERRRGDTGRIFNKNTYSELEKIYEASMSKLPEKRLIKIDTTEINPGAVCEIVLSRLNLKL